MSQSPQSAVTLPAGVRIRPLTPQDVRGAIAVKNRGWHDAYSAWLSAEALAGMDANFERTVAGWTAALEEGRLLPSWVAIGPDDAVVGLGSGGPVEVTAERAGRLAGDSAGAVARGARMVRAAQA